MNDGLCLFYWQHRRRMAARGTRPASPADSQDRDPDAVPTNKRGNADACSRIPRGIEKTRVDGGRQRPI
jgi:hypothetical protein